jgi:hypothetical protein
MLEDGSLKTLIYSHLETETMVSLTSGSAVLKSLQTASMLEAARL